MDIKTETFIQRAAGQAPGFSEISTTRVLCPWRGRLPDSDTGVSRGEGDTSAHRRLQPEVGATGLLHCQPGQGS